MSDKGTLQCYNKKKLKQDGYMSKRWFDLLATIGLAIFIIFGYNNIFSYYDEEFIAYLLCYVVIGFGLRRFFYNKEK